MLTRNVCFLCAALFAFTSVGLVRAEDHTQDKIEQVKQAVKEKKAVLLDVREKSEWEKGHLKDAKLLSLSALKGDVKIEEVRKLIPQGAIVYCHCASGYRCLEAAPLLRKLGYEVRALEPGFKALVKAGFDPAPMEKVELVK
ncbi:MAG: rhodanese-like domain-containing protein [Pirellulaceae bacterium]|nr:rhodanese-like domain-containing protein [Pirellulaceae bacterium]